MSLAGRAGKISEINLAPDFPNNVLKNINVCSGFEYAYAAKINII
jgi:hypothetical protein